MKKIITLKETAGGKFTGGKFQKQAEMIKANIPVPNFFCLTKFYYDEVFLQIKDKVQSIIKDIDFQKRSSVSNAAEQIHKMFINISLTTLQVEQIHKAFDKEFKPNTLVSVRSSMVGHIKEESEDSSENPFAGISKTSLYVIKEQLIDTIKDCWSSGYSEEALIYRQTQSMNLFGFSVAVGIQQMIKGTRSFVMFTANPNTASKDIIIIAGYGIGEGVVQEQVEVDHYFINEKSQQIEKEIVTKKKQIVFDQEKGFGIKTATVSENLTTIPCLTDKEIRKLEEYGKKIEQIFREPQDIEGTITEKGDIYFLQSRPIALDYSKMKIWTNANVTESFPGVTTVLTYSFAKFFYREIFYDSYLRLGVSRKKLKENHEPLNQMIGFLEGRIYYNLSHFYLLHQQSPLFPIFREHWENTIGLQSSYNASKSNGVLDRLKKLKTKIIFIGAILHTIGDYLYHSKNMKKFYSWWGNLMQPLRGKPFSEKDPLALVNQFHRIWKEVGNQWGTTLTNDAYLILLYGFTENLFKKWNLDKNSGLLSDLLCGDESLTSVEILLSALNLAENVRNDPKLSELFKTKTESELLNLLENGKIEANFSKLFYEHLFQYGDRGLQELKLEVPSMRENPIILIRSIKQFALQNKTVKSIRKHEQEVRNKSEIKLRKLLKKSPVKLHFLLRILKRLRKLVQDRENSRYCRSELFGISRSIFKAIGNYLVSRDVLNDTSDIFHLTQEEIFGYIDGSGYSTNLKTLVDIRKKEFEINLEKTPKDNITTFGAIPDNELESTIEENESDNNGTLYKGLGSSIGKVTGKTRVIFDPTTVSSILEDEILIAKETDPGWLFLMLASKGMIVERGSMLSHTAITGRKFGIPTVVGLKNATKVIPNEALIEMDGGSGRVEILRTNTK